MRSLCISISRYLARVLRLGYCWLRAWLLLWPVGAIEETHIVRAPRRI